MGPTLTYTEEGGSRSEDAGEIICCGHVRDTYIWVGDLGGDPPNGKEPEGIPPLGGEEYHGKATEDMDIWERGKPPNRGGAKGSGY